VDLDMDVDVDVGQLIAWKTTVREVPGSIACFFLAFLVKILDGGFYWISTSPFSLTMDISVF